MPGRHAQMPDRQQRRRIALVAAGAGILLVAGGILTWTLTGTPARATTVANAVDAPTAGAPAGDAAGDQNAPPAALAACARAVESGNRVVEAAAVSREHWGGHVQAQLDFDAGRINRQQMADAFAATKATGPADLASFDAARVAYAPLSSACTGMDGADLPQRWQPAATRCAQRAGELAIAVPASEAVVADWRAHVEMMQAKLHTDPKEYGQMWRDMVAAAPAHLNGYTTARDALDRQPACTITEN
jgi:hypothetical protein